MMALRSAAISLLAVTPALAAASGKVVTPDGHPIPGAEVCVVDHGVSTDCQKTDAYGFYHLAHPATLNLFIRATGFQSARVAAVEQSASIVLTPAAILKVLVKDEVTGRPVPQGRVTINSTSGLQVGSTAPFNAQGVRVTTMAPGDFLVRAESDGYEPGGPEPVTVVEGRETAVVVKMKKRASAPH